MAPHLKAEEQAPLRREQYEQERMEIIARLTKFEPAQLQLVETELAKYDEKRYQTWEESWQIEQRLSNEDANLTDDEIASLVGQLLELETARHQAKIELFATLGKSLTPRQLVSVYLGMKGINAQVGRSLRSKWSSSVKRA